MTIVKIDIREAACSIVAYRLCEPVGCLDQGADIAVTERKRLQSVRIVGSLRHVVGHRQVGVAHLYVEVKKIRRSIHSSRRRNCIKAVG